MKCMCTGCGKKIESGRLCFDFTDFIRKKLISAIKEQEGGEGVVADCIKLFNEWKATKPLIESEEKLCNLKSAADEAGSEYMRYVRYKIPAEEIIDRAGKYDGGRTDKEPNKFVAWLNGYKDIPSGFFELCLKKTGDGDIRVNQVYDADEGEEIAAVRRCPECFSEVSFWAGRYKEICLTVLGGPRVSKSTTLTACVSAFLEGDGLIQWEGSEDDSAWKLFKKDYLEKYREGVTILPTDNQMDNIPRLSFRVCIGNEKICLTFVDLPGEYNNKDGINSEIFKKYRYFYENIDFIWYCTDPGEVKQLQGTADNSEDIRALGYEKGQEIINVGKLKSNMTDLASYFKAAKKGGERVRAAYILGKTDADIISDDEKKEYGLFLPEEKEVYDVFDVRRFYNQSDKVRKYMKLYNPGMVKAFEDNFENRCYIAISAYGYNPKDFEKGKTEATKQPYHCRLPFYWMMALTNHIDIKLKVERKKSFGRTYMEEMEARLAELSERDKKNVLDNLHMHGSYSI